MPAKGVSADALCRHIYEAVMSKVLSAQAELREMDELSARTSPIHRLHPLTKLLVTLIYLVTVVSYPKYSFSALFRSEERRVGKEC